MTSINAMKFDEYSGLMICDEERSWNDDSLKMLTADKIKYVIDERVQKEQGIVAAYGNTGTSSIGDELKFKIKKQITTRYQSELDRLGEIPARFLSMEEIGTLAFDEIIKMKHKHIDETLTGRYGFTANDFCRGYYIKDGQRYDISDKDVIKKVEDIITWKSRGEESKPIFLNAGIIAGYAPGDGFRIYHMSQIEFFCEPVETIFVADGSGRDTCNIVMAEYTSDKTLAQRGGAIDRVEGLYALLVGVNTASWHNLGVGGYYKIMYFNGKEKNNMARYKEIADHRSKLASEIVNAGEALAIKKQDAFKLLDDLVYNDVDLETVDDRFHTKAQDTKKLKRLLRGYKSA